MTSTQKAGNGVDLTIDLNGLVLNNPIIAASGTFGYGDEIADYDTRLDFGAICAKSITPLPRDGHPSPRIAEVDGGMLNAIGLANIGVDAFCEEKLSIIRELDTKIIVSVAGFSLEDYINVIRKMEQYDGIDAYEINISSPNAREVIEFGQSAVASSRLIKAIRSETERYLIVKLSPNVTDITEIALAVEQEKPDAISMINTLVGMGVDLESNRPLLRRIYGGLSGSAIKPVALAMIHKVSEVVKLPIIGMGGIRNAEDAAEFMIAGASAVQIGTVNFANPDAVNEIILGLKTIAESKRMKKISELTGSLKQWE